MPCSKSFSNCLQDRALTTIFGAFLELFSYIIDAATLSGILKAMQKLGVTFNSDKLGGIDFTNFSKLSMCSAGASRC